MSARLGVTRDTVRARLAELVGAGLLRLVRRGTHGRRCTLYRVRPAPDRATGSTATGRRIRP